MKNESGIYPCGRFVLVKPDDIEEQTDGGIFLPSQHLERHEWGTSSGYLVAAGPDAWTHSTTRYESDDGRSVSVDGFSRPFAQPGDRVMFAPQGGRSQKGKDGKTYRMLNDTDILAIVDDEVEFMSIPEARKAAGGV